MADKRPTLGAPSRAGMGAFGGTNSGVLDGIMKQATGAFPTVPPPPVVEPEPELADPPPVPAARSEPVVRAAPASARPARPAGPRRRRARTAATDSGYAGVPAMPGDFASSRKPLQVYLPPHEHWALKQQTFARGTDMSKVVEALVTLFNTDPDRLLSLIEAAEDNQQSLGEFLSPSLKVALDMS